MQRAINFFTSFQFVFGLSLGVILGTCWMTGALVDASNAYGQVIATYCGVRP